MRENLKRSTAYFLVVTAVLSQMPLPAEAFETGGYSSKTLDRGLVVGVYNPYYKELKIFHYWIVRGKGYTDKSSNTACSYVGDALEVAVSSRQVTCPAGWRRAVDSVPVLSRAVSDSKVRVSPLVNGLYYCPSSGITAYKTPSGYFEASYDLTPFSVCRRIVDSAWINARFKPNNPFSKGQAGSSGGIRNVYFTDIPYGSGSQKGAVQLLTAYMQVTGAPSAVLAVEGLHFHKHKHKCGLFRKCVDYIWDEQVSYQEVSKAPSPTPIGYGYYLSSKGIGSNLYVHPDRIKKITKKGWSFIAVAIAQVALVGLTGGLGIPYLAPALGGLFLSSDAVSGLQHGWGGGAYSLGEGITPGAFNDFGKDTKKAKDPGSKELTSRFEWGSDLSPQSLDGYEMAKRLYNAYLSGWTPEAPLSTAVVKAVSSFRDTLKVEEINREMMGEKGNPEKENFFGRKRW